MAYPSTLQNPDVVDTRNIATANIVTGIGDIATAVIGARNSANQGAVEEIIQKLEEIARVCRDVKL